MVIEDDLDLRRLVAGLPYGWFATRKPSGVYIAATYYREGRPSLRVRGTDWREVLRLTQERGRVRV